LRWSTKRTIGGHRSVGALPRSYQVTPAVLGRRRATQRKASQTPRVDNGKESQPAVDREPNRPAGRHHRSRTSLSLSGIGVVRSGDGWRRMRSSGGPGLRRASRRKQGARRGVQNRPFAYAEPAGGVRVALATPAADPSRLQPRRRLVRRQPGALASTRRAPATPCDPASR
jgi:hypothetical protein